MCRCVRTGIVDHGEPEQLLETTDGDGTADNGEGILADDQDMVEIDDGGGRVVNNPVDQPPIIRCQRIRKVWIFF